MYVYFSNGDGRTFSRGIDIITTITIFHGLILTVISCKASCFCCSRSLFWWTQFIDSELPVISRLHMYFWRHESRIVLFSSGDNYAHATTYEIVHLSSFNNFIPKLRPFERRRLSNSISNPPNDCLMLLPRENGCQQNMQNRSYLNSACLAIVYYAVSPLNQLPIVVCFCLLISSHPIDNRIALKCVPHCIAKESQIER